MQKDRQAEIRNQNYTNAMWLMDEVIGKLLLSHMQRMRSRRKTGSWISVNPSTTNEMYLGVQ